MDTESLKSLSWLLVWAGLFFIMMRYGCGAHMSGGHRHDGVQGLGSAGTESKDPVCGMRADSKTAAAMALHAGRTYFFCSRACRDTFERAPARYLDARSHPRDGQEEHHHV